MNSGADIAVILAGIQNDLKNGTTSTVTISSGAISLSGGAQGADLGKLLAYKGTASVTFTGNLTITAGANRTILPETTVNALGNFGGKISQMSGAPEFHVPTIGNMDLLKSLFTSGSYVHVTTNRGYDLNFDYVKTAVPDTTFFTENTRDRNDFAEYITQLPVRTDGSFYWIYPNKIWLGGINDTEKNADGQLTPIFDRFYISQVPTTPDIKVDGTLTFRAVRLLSGYNGNQFSESVSRHIAAARAAYIKDPSLIPPKPPAGGVVLGRVGGEYRDAGQFGR